MSQTWSLENVKQIGKENPYTFYLPSEEAISLLKEGDAVKLMFSCDVENDQGWNAERMWVEITARTKGSFSGFLDNDPYYIPDIKAGDILSFRAEHIMQISIDDPVPNEVDKYLPRCYVTGDVLYKKNLVGELFREEPNEKEIDKNYSGWTLLSGTETEEYLNNSENWYFVSLGAVLNIDDRFKNLLSSAYDSEFVWDQDRGEYTKI